MISLTVLTLLVLGALLVHYLWVAERRWILGPESFFLALAAPTFFATMFAALEAGSPESPYVVFIGCGILSFIAGTGLARIYHRFSHSRELSDFIDRPWRNDLRGHRMALVIAVGLLAICVTALYFYLLGFYVPFEALATFLTSGKQEMMATYSQLRKQTSAVGTYLAPGYVSQFRNTLLPLVTILLYFRMRARPTLRGRVLFAFFLVSSLLATVGTGGRFALAFFGGSLLILGMSPLLKPLRFSRLQMAMAGLLVLGLLSGLTLMMGARGQDRLGIPVLWAPVQVVDRIFVAPAEERFEVYQQFLEGRAPQLGAATLTELRNILPGRPPMTLSNRLHQMLYGSPRGNVALDYWGIMWYDFRWFALPLVAIYGFLMHSFYVWMIRGTKRLSRVLILAFAGLIFGLATDLQVLVLRGFLTCLSLLVLLDLMDAFARASAVSTKKPARGQPIQGSELDRFASADS